MAVSSKVHQGQMVEKEDVLFEWDPHTNTILTEKIGQGGIC